MYNGPQNLSRKLEYERKKRKNNICLIMRSITNIELNMLRQINSKLCKIYTKGCFLMYNGPQDVSGNVNRTSDTNFALGISGIGHRNIQKLTFQQCPQMSTTLLEESALIY